MQTKIKNVYYCEFCGKKGMVKYIIEFHEQFCTKNPSVTPKCFTCQFLETDEFQVDFDRGDYGEPDYVRKAKIFRCLVQDGKIVFAPKFVGKMLQHRKRHNHLKDSAHQGFEKLLAASRPMPIKCNKFKATTSAWYINGRLPPDTEYIEPTYPELEG